MDKMLVDGSSGIETPAAVIAEAVQGEGGLNVATAEWLQKLEKVCRKHDMLLIIDDIQAGNGRTGQFFSFEQAGIKPDMVTVSKSLSGYGLPMALVLFHRDLDAWAPGEHNGTFRGNNMAFVTARAAIETYWKDESFANEVKQKSEILGTKLQAICDQYGAENFQRKGRGMMQGIACRDGELADDISKQAFKKGLIIETAGPDDEVVKCLMPLTISEEDLTKGLDLLTESVADVMKDDMSQAS
ncbi:hypothetical protein CF392_14990 [Tamilnaduibacter salinus]|nr:hypothetical protein CF392_14990 [Tamilnaduibacter salinus]